MTTTNLDTDGLRYLHSQATSEWRAAQRDGRWVIVSPGQVEPVAVLGQIGDEQAKADAVCIVAARNALPRLLTALAAARREERERCAEAIFADEQKCQAAITADPTDTWMQGRLVGLQRARDIAVRARPYTEAPTRALPDAAPVCGADVDGHPCVREPGHHDIGPCNNRWPGGLPETEDDQLDASEAYENQIGRTPDGRWTHNGTEIDEDDLVAAIADYADMTETHARERLHTIGQRAPIADPAVQAEGGVGYEPDPTVNTAAYSANAELLRGFLATGRATDTEETQ